MRKLTTRIVRELIILVRRVAGLAVVIAIAETCSVVHSDERVRRDAVLYITRVRRVHGNAGPVAVLEFESADGAFFRRTGSSGLIVGNTRVGVTRDAFTCVAFAHASPRYASRPVHRPFAFVFRFRRRRRARVHEDRNAGALLAFAL